MAIFSAIGRSRCLPFIVPTVPTGLISVMPQPCMTVTPYFVSKVSIMAWGAAEPPTRRRSSRGGFLPRASISFSMPSHTVGHAERQADALGLEQLAQARPVQRLQPGKTSFAPTIVAA